MEWPIFGVVAKMYTIRLEKGLEFLGYLTEAGMFVHGAGEGGCYQLIIR